MYVTLTPAYGRDYKSAKAAIADYDAGKDFVLNKPWGNQLINKQQCVAEGMKVNIRYASMRKITTVK